MSAGYTAPPDHAALAQARSLVAVRRWQQAITALGPALMSEATAVEAHCLRAQCLFGLGQPAEAAKAARQALARNPHSPWAHRLLAMGHLAGRRPRAARDEAAAAARLAPRSVHGLYLLTLSHLALRDRGPAEQAAHAAVAENPHDPLAHLAMAKVAENRRDWATAEGAYREGLRLDPADADLAIGLGRLLHRLGRRDEAAAAYLAAGRSDPVDARPRRGLARLGLPLVAGTGLVIKLAMVASVRVVLFTAVGRPDRAALTAGVILLLGCATTLALRIHGTRNLPGQVRDGLKADHRNAALRWLQIAAVVAVFLAIWAAAAPARSGGGTPEAVAFAVFAAAAWLVAHFCWTGTRRGTTEFFRAVQAYLRAVGARLIPRGR